MNNKSGAVGEGLTIINFIFILVVISAFIIFSVYWFYGGGFNFQEDDASLLNYRVRNCIENQGLDVFNQDFISICGLNKDVLEKYEILRVCKGNDMNNCLIRSDPLFSLGSNFQICGLVVKNKDIKCVMENMQIDKEKIIVVAGSRQFARRI